MKIIKGVTEFWAETGTEGGYWAVQDEKHIKHDHRPEYGLWTGEKVRDIKNPERKGLTVGGWCLEDGRPLPDPMTQDELWWRDPEAAYEKWGRQSYGVSYGEVTVGQVEWEDGVCEERRSDTLLVTKWDYAGLNVLETGDYLKIFDPEDESKVVWEGKIELIDQGLFNEDAFGLWIHADQKGMDREEWAKLFMEEHPCELHRHDHDWTEWGQDEVWKSPYMRRDCKICGRGDVRKEDEIR